MSGVPYYAYLTHFLTLYLLLLYRLDARVLLVTASLLIAGIVNQLMLSDYLIYSENFNGIDPRDGIVDNHSLFYSDYGFYVINYLFRTIFDNYSVLNYVLIFVSLLIKNFFLVRWGKVYFVSIVFYVSLMFYPDSYLIRSTFAASLSLVGIWGMLNQKSALAFFAPVILASTIHISALVILPVWFFRKIRISSVLSLICVGGY